MNYPPLHESDDEKFNAGVDEDADAALAKQLQNIENEQAARAFAQQPVMAVNQQQVVQFAIQQQQILNENPIVIQQPQVQTVVIQQPNANYAIHPMNIVDPNNNVDPSQPAGTFVDWYHKSIRDKQFNKCSAGCANISAYSSCMTWLFSDIFHCGVHIIIAITAFTASDKSLGIGLFIAWLILASTNLIAFHGVNKMIEFIIIMKIIAFIFETVLFCIEAVFVHNVFVFIYIGLIVTYAVLAFFAMRDTYKIYRWIKYYKSGGPYCQIIP